MSKAPKTVAPEAAVEEVVAVDNSASTYEVTLNSRFPYMDFAYMPSDHHTVDHTIYTAMVSAGVIADVKQLS